MPGIAIYLNVAAAIAAASGPVRIGGRIALNPTESYCFLPRRLKSLNDDFRKLLGHRDGTHVDNELIDLAILVEVHLIDRLKLPTPELALKAKESTNCSLH
jgi:hypothetical protein